MKKRYAFAAAVLVLGCTDHSKSEKNRQITAEASLAVMPEKYEGAPENAMGAHLVSQNFLYCWGDSGALILHETVDQQVSSGAEFGDGQITVKAYRQSLKRAEPIWTISAPGYSGDASLGSTLYELKQAACCDMSERSVYYDINTGIQLFSSTAPKADLYLNQEMRYVGYDDGCGGGRPAEMDSDRSIAGILFFAGKKSVQRIAVIADSLKEYRQQEFSLALGDSVLINKNGKIFAQDDSCGVLRVELFCRCDTNEFIEIPIDNYELSPKKAKVSNGVKIRVLDPIVPAK